MHYLLPILVLLATLLSPAAALTWPARPADVVDPPLGPARLDGDALAWFDGSSADLLALARTADLYQPGGSTVHTVAPRPADGEAALALPATYQPGDGLSICRVWLDGAATALRWLSCRPAHLFAAYLPALHRGATP